jgi:predicted N-acetyltransferase YhbS
MGGKYYDKFGFTPAYKYHIYRPNPLKGQHYNVLELSAGALEGVCGVVKYPFAFKPTLNQWYKN